MSWSANVLDAGSPARDTVVSTVEPLEPGQQRLQAVGGYTHLTLLPDLDHVIRHHLMLLLTLAPLTTMSRNGSASMNQKPCSLKLSLSSYLPP